MNSKPNIIQYSWEGRSRKHKLITDYSDQELSEMIGLKMGWKRDSRQEFADNWIPPGGVQYRTGRGTSYTVKPPMFTGTRREAEDHYLSL